jgi:hypothetical protein
MKLLLPFGLLAGPCVFVSAGHNTQTAHSNDISQTIEATYAQNEFQAVQNPLEMGAMIPSSASDSPRHRQEKAHLMKRMARKHGNWGSSHPRYRLFESLFSFSKYHERNMAELDRLRGLYNNVGKAQKKVCGFGHPIGAMLTESYVDSGDCGELQ